MGNFDRLYNLIFEQPVEAGADKPGKPTPEELKLLQQLHKSTYNPKSTTDQKNLEYLRQAGKLAGGYQDFKKLVPTAYALQYGNTQQGNAFKKRAEKMGIKFNTQQVQPNTTAPKAQTAPVNQSTTSANNNVSTSKPTSVAPVNASTNRPSISINPADATTSQPQNISAPIATNQVTPPSTLTTDRYIQTDWQKEADRVRQVDPFKADYYEKIGKTTEEIKKLTDQANSLKQTDPKKAQELEKTINDLTIARKSYRVENPEYDKFEKLLDLDKYQKYKKEKEQEEKSNQTQEKSLGSRLRAGLDAFMGTK